MNVSGGGRPKAEAASLRCFTASFERPASMSASACLRSLQYRVQEAGWTSGSPNTKIRMKTTNMRSRLSIETIIVELEVLRS